MRFRPNSLDTTFFEIRNPSVADIEITEDYKSIDIISSNYLLSKPEYPNKEGFMQWNLVLLDSDSPSVDTTMVDLIYDSLKHKTSLIEFNHGEFLRSASFLVHTRNISIIPTAVKNRYNIRYDFYIVAANYDEDYPLPTVLTFDATDVDIYLGDIRIHVHGTLDRVPTFIQYGYQGQVDGTWTAWAYHGWFAYTGTTFSHTVQTPFDELDLTSGEDLLGVRVRASNHPSPSSQDFGPWAFDTILYPETDVSIAAFVYYFSGGKYFADTSVQDFNIPGSIGWSFRIRYTNFQQSNGCSSGTGFGAWSSWTDVTSGLTSSVEVSPGMSIPGQYTACQIQVGPKFSGENPVYTDQACDYVLSS
jgi:hypothetical protein